VIHPKQRVAFFVTYRIGILAGLIDNACRTCDCVLAALRRLAAHVSLSLGANQPAEAG
jgi:hypothetical protein